MSDHRIDELSGARVVVTGSRQHRPNRPGVAACPFCVGGLEAPEPYEVKAFPNRWPSFPDDRCEVVLYTPEHDLTFPDLGVEGARRVVDLWADRTAVLGARDDVAYVLVFENRGEEVGATVAHPHGQIYAYDQVPGAPLTELRRADGGACPLCDPADDALTVTAASGWRAWVPASDTTADASLRASPATPRTSSLAVVATSVALSLVVRSSVIVSSATAAPPRSCWRHLPTVPGANKVSGICSSGPADGQGRRRPRPRRGGVHPRVPGRRGA